MGTLATLKTRVASDINRGDVSSSDSRVSYAIADAVDEYNRKRFWFNQARSTFSTTAGTEFYTTSVIPADIGEIDALTLEYSGSRVKLVRWGFGPGELINTTTTGSQGQPAAWSWYDEQIRIYPIPDATYTIRISYLQILPVPSADGNSNAWTTEAEQLIRQCAVRIFHRDRSRDQGAEAAAQRAEAQILQRLMKRTNQLDTGMLLPSGI